MTPVFQRRSRVGAGGLVIAAVIVASCGEPRPERLRTAARPPSTRVAPVSDVMHGVSIADQFRWLEAEPDAAGAGADDVSRWADAQHRYTRTVLDALPERAALEARLTALLQVGSVTPPIVRGNRYFFAVQPAGRAELQIVVRDGAFGADRVLVDPSVIDPSGATAVTWISPAESGAEIAYGTYRAGDAATTLHLIDVEASSRPSLEIPHVLPGVQWLPDGAGFIYQRLRDPKDPQSGEGVLHRRGTPIGAGAVLFKQSTRRAGSGGVSLAAPFVSLSRDGRWLLVGTWTDPVSNDLVLVDFDAFRRTGRLVSSVQSRGDRGMAQGMVVNGVVHLHTTKGSPNGRVLAAQAATGSAPAWRTVVPERPDAVIESVAYGSGLIAVTYRIDAASVIEVFSSAGEPRGRLALPATGTASVAAFEDRTEAYLSFTSFHVPPSVWRVDLAAPRAAPRLWSSAGSSVDDARAEVSQVSYRSKDGTRLNMFLIHRPGLDRTDATPTVLSGYGGWGVNMLPAYSAAVAHWVEAGGLVAVPTLRGGSEYGQGWHAAGARADKRRAIEDLVAAAEWLIASHYTSPDRLAVTAEAHGALVAAAAVVERPDLFRAAALSAPLTDMLRYPLFPMGAGMAVEYGDPREADAFGWLRAYSPYHRVREGIRYPAMLLTAPGPGGPLAPAHARKFAAAVQRATSADPSEQPVLLRVDRATTGAVDLAAWQLRSLVDERIFLLWQVGELPSGRGVNRKDR